MINLNASIVRPRALNRFDRESDQVMIGLLGGFAVLAGLGGIVSGSMLAMALAGIAVSGLVLREARFGLYLVAACVALDSVVYDPVSAPFAKLYQGLPVIKATPIELLILMTCVSWLIRCASTKQFLLPNRSLVVAVSIFSAFIVLAFERGVSSGGDLVIALWEARALLTLLPMIFLTAGLLTERRHVYELVGVIGVALIVSSAEIAWRYLVFIRPGEAGGPLEHAFNHDGSILVGFLAVIGAATLIWSPNRKHQLIALAVVLVAGFIVLASRRRAAVITTEVAFVTLGLALLLTNWRRFMLLVPLVLLVGIVYSAAFWNNENSLGQPVRAFRSVFQHSEKSDRDRSSDDYRRAEHLNVMWGIRATPLTGIGFGVPYAKPLPFPNLSSFWPFWEYTPHNTILWLWLKGGVIPFMAFWFIVGSAAAQAGSILRRTRDPFVIAVSSSILGYITMVILFSYVDLGLTSARLMIIFGIGLALLSVLERLWLVPATEPPRVRSYARSL